MTWCTFYVRACTSLYAWHATTKQCSAECSVHYTAHRRIVCTAVHRVESAHFMSESVLDSVRCAHFTTVHCSAECSVHYCMYCRMQVSTVKVQSIEYITLHIEKMCALQYRVERECTFYDCKFCQQRLKCLSSDISKKLSFQIK